MPDRHRQVPLQESFGPVWRPCVRLGMQGQQKGHRGQRWPLRRRGIQGGYTMARREGRFINGEAEMASVYGFMQTALHARGKQYLCLEGTTSCPFAV